MAMQDVDFEMKYQPGKDEQDPLDCLSEYPSPANNGNDDAEYIVNQIIREESRKDKVFQKLRTVITKGTGKTTSEIQKSHHFVPLKMNFTSCKA